MGKHTQNKWKKAGNGISQQHSAALSSTQQHSAALSSTQQHSAVLNLQPISRFS